MKVKELIRQLQLCDPEAVVCSGGQAIYFAHQLPGYYDGWYEYLEDGKFVMTDKGTKVVLCVRGLEDYLGDDPDGEVIIDSQWKDTNSRLKEKVERLRKQAVEIHEGTRDDFDED